MTPEATITTTEGFVVAYDEFGDPDATPLLVIQGLGAQMIGWPPGFCQQLADQGLRVIRIENRDVGRSQRHPAGGYALSDLVADTVGLLDALDLGSVHVVGQSMGGMVAQQVAIDRPERVRSLGLVFTTSSVRHFIGRGDVDDRMAVASIEDRDQFVRWYVAGEEACASRDYPQELAWLEELAGQMFDRGHDLDGVGRQLEMALSSTDRDAALRELRVPTAIVVGDCDRLIDHGASVELHDLVAGSTLRVFPGMGHELPEPLWPDLVSELTANVRRAESRATSAAQH